MTATYKQYCLWKSTVSDAAPTVKEFQSFSVSDLQTISSECKRIAKIRQEYATEATRAEARATRAHK